MKIMKIKQEIKIGDTTFIFNSPNILDESTTDVMNDWCRLVEQQQIIDKAYENYQKEILRQRELQKEEVNRLRSQGKRLKVILIELLSQEQFINKCKTNPEFSEKWGLKIEERELGLEERCEFDSNQDNVRNTWGQVIQTFTPKEVRIWLNEKNIPTKLTTITYNNKTIESYE